MENFNIFDEEYDGESPGNSPGQGTSSSANPSPLKSNKKAMQAAKQKGGNVDLSALDDESIEVMAMLMLYIIKNDLSAKEVFESKVFD